MSRTHVHCLHERKKGRDRERTEGRDEWRNSEREGGKDREYEREEDMRKEREKERDKERGMEKQSEWKTNTICGNKKNYFHTCAPYHQKRETSGLKHTLIIIFKIASQKINN